MQLRDDQRDRIKDFFARFPHLQLQAAGIADTGLG